MKRITLVGGGLAGSLAAVYLAKRGYEVNIYERRPDMRNVEIPAGRSINLALSTRGIDALKRVGLDQVVLDQAIPMAGRMMHDEKGNLAYQPYGKDGQVINSVSRAHLNIQLLKLADEHKNVNQFFNMRCQEVDIENSICKFTNEKTGENIEVKSDYILGSDGAYSPVRLKMMKNDRFDYSQSYTNSGYKELNITPTPDGNFAMDPDSLHIWPRGNFMMIALPNPDKSFTCTLFMPYAGEVGFDQTNSDQEILNFMNTYFADAVPLMPELLDDFKRNPVGSLVTVRCYPWHMKKATLIGDACHAIVPFYGQGMNCAFEDCVELDNCLEEFGDWDKAMNEYQKRRKPNADAIADLALQNFIEMRDLVGDKDFLHYKKMEHQLCELYPDLFKSQYEMVTFSKVPYSEAKTKGAQNTQRVHDLIASNYEDKITDRSFVEEWFA
ncbi:MAG: NAD(P)/FAD-dependent oxidoreductase [Bacteroidia bacterium]|nr:NAD(P)/FAD-dependent oxidoreductase [Bacteroidia bacterium]